MINIFEYIMFFLIFQRKITFIAVPIFIASGDDPLSNGFEQRLQYHLGYPANIGILRGLSAFVSFISSTE